MTTLLRNFKLGFGKARSAQREPQATAVRPIIGMKRRNRSIVPRPNDAVTSRRVVSFSAGSDHPERVSAKGSER